MCICNTFDNESLHCVARSTSDREGSAPASLSWKKSTGGRQVEKDTAVSFSAGMDWCLEDDRMDWTAVQFDEVMFEAEKGSSDNMDWTAVQFDEVVGMEWMEGDFDEEMEYCDLDMEIDEDEDVNADSMEFQAVEFADTMNWELISYVEADVEMVDQMGFMDCD
jgi:hypothetical protein